jgi:hypothetical protein
MHQNLSRRVPATGHCDGRAAKRGGGSGRGAGAHCRTDIAASEAGALEAGHYCRRRYAERRQAMTAMARKRLCRSASVSFGLRSTLRGIPNHSPENELAASAVLFPCDSSGELVASVGADAETFLSAPVGKSIRVYIDTLGHVPLILQSLFGFLCSLYPLIPSGREFIGVLKAFEERGIVLFAEPSDADNSDWIALEISHDIRS